LLQFIPILEQFIHIPIIVISKHKSHHSNVEVSDKRLGKSIWLISSSSKIMNEENILTKPVSQ
ncbi:hypothetical protein TrispH2_006819, partial [Trichoplax sp. H2]